MKTETQVKIETVAKYKLVGQRRKLFDAVGAIIEAQETQQYADDRDKLDEAAEILFSILLRTTSLSPRHARIHRRPY
jgi:DNA-binding transcriptional regulator GbsR (MarR family)